MWLSKAGDCNRKNQWRLETNRLSCFKTITKLLHRYIDKTKIMKKILYFIALLLLLCGSCNYEQDENGNEKTRYLKISDSKCIDLYTGDTVLYSRVDYLPTDEEIIELKKKLELTGGESIP